MKKLFLTLLLVAGLSFSGAAQGIFFTIDSVKHVPYVCAAAAYGVTVEGWRSSYAVVLDSSSHFYRNDTLFTQLFFKEGSGGATPVRYNHTFSVQTPNNLGIYKIAVQGFYQKQLHKSAASSIVVCWATPVVLGLAEKAAPDFSIFPNPAKGIVTVETGGAAGKLLALTVTDLTGKTIVVQPLQQEAKKVQLDLSALPSGVYLLQLRTNTGTLIRKIVKE